MMRVSVVMVMFLVDSAFTSQPQEGQRPGRSPDSLSQEAEEKCSEADGALLDKVNLCECLEDKVSSWVACYSQQAAKLGVPPACLASMEVQNTHAEANCGCSPKHFSSPDVLGRHCHFDQVCDDCMGGAAAGLETSQQACEDLADWVDNENTGCDWYDSSRCADFGDGFANDGYTANIACCICGGGRLSDLEPEPGSGNETNETNDTVPTPAPTPPLVPTPQVPWPPEPLPTGPPPGGNWLTWIVSVILLLIMTLFGGGGVLIVRRVRIHRRGQTEEEMELAGISS